MKTPLANRKWIRTAVACAAGLLFLVAMLPVIPAFSQSRYSMAILLRCTREDAIMKAFALMADSQGEPSLRRIVSKPIRVLFKDMKTLNKGLKNYDALSWISNQGEQVIFINQKHSAAPAEALAAMIAHEAMHDDEFNSLSEETASWEFEARVWMEMKARNPVLAEIPAGQSLLVDRENTIETEYRKGTLKQFVRSRPGYLQLPETSPGFDGGDGSVTLTHRP